jgi:hypothetical protein
MNGDINRENTDMEEVKTPTPSPKKVKVKRRSFGDNTEVKHESKEDNDDEEEVAQFVPPAKGTPAAQALQGPCIALSVLYSVEMYRDLIFL